MLYRTKNAVLIKLQRYERGQVVDLDDATASPIIDDLIPLENKVSVPSVKVEEVDYAKLSKQELVKIASDKGLSILGSKADILERIQLSIN